MKIISFNDVPQVLAEVNQKLDTLIAESASRPKEDKTALMTIDALRVYLPVPLARQTIYGLVHRRRIPFEKFGKQLYFRKSAIDAWLANGRQVVV
ncbi:MAG: helix-turn-helix domain-containing protein [Bacteroidales bacterium]|nr:helix-turn-helix domain-containing protein [Bacteroidales bacterium]